MAVRRSDRAMVRGCAGAAVRSGLVLALLSTAAALPARAHHSFAAEFDIDKPIKLTGTITEMRWANPHSWIYIDVKDESGTVVNWAFEMAGANGLYRRGWRPVDVVVGSTVTIEGWAARSGKPAANSGAIILPDGRRMFAGSPGSETPPR